MKRWEKGLKLMQAAKKRAVKAKSQRPAGRPKNRRMEHEALAWALAHLP